MSVDGTAGDASVLEYPVTPPDLPRDPTPERLKLSPRSSPGSPGSPDSRCPICLARQENRAFTDGCMHQFCFTCIQEWSKVRAVCPLCKQPFTAIIHNVRSDRDYDRYTLPEPPRPPVDPAHLISQSFLYRPGDVLTTSRWARRQYRFHSMLAPMLWPSHTPVESVDEIPDFHLPTVPSVPRSRRRASSSGSVTWPRSRVTSHQRRQVYVDNMWARPSADQLTGRYRETGPEFYRANPACTHRLVPWINRELTAILSSPDQQLPHLLRTIVNQLNTILEQLQRVHILSHQFRRLLQPALGSWTEHFVHELYTFARSPYDMVGYDLTVQYASGRPESTLSTVVIDSSNSASSGADDDVDVVMTGARDSPMRRDRISPNPQWSPQQDGAQRVGTSWRHSQSSDSDIQVVGMSADDAGGSPEPGPSGMGSSLAEFGALLHSAVVGAANRQRDDSLGDEAATSNNEQDSAGTDDVQVVRVLPPLSARAELVTLSDSEPTANRSSSSRLRARSRRTMHDCDNDIPDNIPSSSSRSRARSRRSQQECDSGSRKRNSRHRQLQLLPDNEEQQTTERASVRRSKHKKRKRRRRDAIDDDSVERSSVRDDNCSGSAASKKRNKKRSKTVDNRRRRSETRRGTGSENAVECRDVATTAVANRLALEPIDSPSSSDESAQVALAAVSNEPLTSRSLRLKRRKLRRRQQLRHRVRQLSSLSRSESEDEHQRISGVQRERSLSNSSRTSIAATVGSHMSVHSEEHTGVRDYLYDVTAATTTAWSTRGNVSDEEDVSTVSADAHTASTSRQRDSRLSTSPSSHSSPPDRGSQSPQRPTLRSLVVLPHGVTLDLNVDSVRAD